MKKFFKVSLLAIAGFTWVAFSIPNNDFEGVITYSMSFGAPQNSPQGGSSMTQGSSMVVYCKGTKVRTEVNSAMMHRIIIGDWSTKEEVTLITTASGDKYEIKPDASKPADETKPDIKYIDSTKNIAGYDCKAAIVTVTSKSGDKNNLTIFYTDKLPYSEDMGKFKGLKGCPMQFGMKARNMTIFFTAQSVQKQSVSDTCFNIPAKGYKVFHSEQEMYKSMSDNAGGGQ